VAEYRGGKGQQERLGNILGLAFDEDGKTILFWAGRFQIDGP
jgi:hypothetical protein